MGLYLFVSAVYGHMAEDTGFEPIPTESGHRSETRTHNLTTRRSKSFPISLFDESLLCYLYTNPQYFGIKRATYLSYSLCFEPLRGTPFRFRFVIPYY